MDFNSCGYCGFVGRILRCSRCKRAYYCCKEHQTSDWKNHRIQCSAHSKSEVVNKVSKNVPLRPQLAAISDGSKLKPPTRGQELLSTQNTEIRSASPITYVGSSENEIISARAEELDPIVDCLEAWMNKSENEVTADPFNDMASFNNKHFNNQYILDVEDKYSPDFRDFSEVKLDIAQSLPPFHHHNDPFEQDIVEQLSNNVIEDMDAYGVCVIDNFLGYERGFAVLNEVINMYKTGVFKDGQLVSNKVKEDLKTIRGDQITWIDGKEAHCSNIGMLIRVVDAIVMKANTMPNNGKMSAYTINGRTKAMVACYPGHGSHYVKHVDNPNRDGRCITAIYYLNADWDIHKNGGLLRIFPEGHQKVADIEPIFDRILFFWSDRRNPHEVQPAFQTRYAITLWYFDAEEREDACRRYQRENQCGVRSSLSNSHLLTNYRNHSVSMQEFT